MDRICRSLVKAGHHVTLVGRIHSTSKPLSERPYKTHRIKCKNQAGKAFYAEYNYRLWRELRSWTFDAICSVDLDTLPAGAWLKTDNRKLVYDAHEWFSETPEVVNRPLIRSIWRMIGNRFVPKTDARYSVAPMLADKLAEEYDMPFGTVRNLPLRENIEVEMPKKKTILYQGWFNPGRGLEQAITAMQWLPDCELVLVGKGPEEGALRRCSEELGVQGRVVFAGFCPPEELPAITRRAWLGLNLLDAVSPSYYYSLANKSLDYIQAGLPSVQMDFPEYRAIDEEYNCYVLLPELDARMLADKIKALVDDQERWLALRENCLKAAAELCWEREEEVLLGIWANLQD